MGEHDKWTCDRKTGSYVQRRKPRLEGATGSLLRGWYNYGNYNDVWEWLPGSVACDLNSGPTFGRGYSSGASAASYVIGEPYRTGRQHPDVLLYYLLNGYSFDASDSDYGLDGG